MLQEIEIGETAIPFIRSCLWPQRALPARLLRLPLENGKIMSYVPSGISRDQAMKLQTTLGIPGVGTCSTKRLTAFILDHLRSPNAPYALFQDYLSEPGDPALANDQFILYQSEVYLFLGSKDAAANKVADAISKSSQFPFLSVLTALTSAELTNNDAVTDKCLDELVDNTQHLIVGAYDEESYIVWSK